MAKITHRCNCGKGLRVYLKTRQWGQDLYYFLDPKTGKPHVLKGEHFIVGVEPKIVTLEAFGIEI